MKKTKENFDFIYKAIRKIKKLEGIQDKKKYDENADNNTNADLSNNNLDESNISLS